MADEKYKGPIPDEIQDSTSGRSEPWLQSTTLAASAEPTAAPKPTLLRRIFPRRTPEEKRRRSAEARRQVDEASDAVGAVVWITIGGIATAVGLIYAFEWARDELAEVDFKKLGEEMRLALTWSDTTPDQTPPKGPPVKPVPVPPVSEATPVETGTEPKLVAEYELGDKDGITQGIMKLKEGWPKGVDMPKWLEDVKTPADAARWAEASGYFKPSEAKDSVIMYKGDTLSVDASGKFQIRNAEGPVDLKTRGFSDTVPTKPR